MTLRVHDISNWQAGLDVSSLDCDAVIFKATEGISFKDAQFTTFLADVGSKSWGAYHFLHHGDIAKQIENFLSIVSSYNGLFIPVVDAELLDVTSDDVHSFVQEYYARTQVYPWVYTSASWVSRITDEWVRANCGLWVAGYPSNAKRTSWDVEKFPYSVAGNVVAWQFTSVFQIPSKRYLDASIFYGNKTAWDKYARGNTGSKNTTSTLSKNGWHAARQVINGEFGDGQDRVNRITAAGGDYESIQGYVNYLLNASDDFLATYVIKGEMGTGDERKYCLGTRYAAVQKVVNKRLKG